ncbi:Calcium-transporting ATPase 3 [Zancudomyces culisetae]|uniref:P-type Na(+) transporter n=1 Tax=Zancudomyces culisetae TaxID=1213189 RepID=A0A1R1PTT7_ZANCU|nr:Calcium-transporting ATPase 3 [Zancudomyces culisetae]|eukprot:OMH84339.1 Calcium-transporting ATPase 3 [Zancudomyces culisetae]
MDLKLKIEESVDDGPLHIITVKEAELRLNTNIQTGLSDEEVAKRSELYGKNALKGEGGVNPFIILLRQFANILVFVLLAAGILSFVVKDWPEGAVIFLTMFLNAGIGFFQEYKAEKTVEALRKMTSPASKVLRNGVFIQLETSELVPGDIVEFQSGDVVGADCRLFDVFNLETDEALLTGEALPVAKIDDVLSDPDEPLGDRINLAFSSTLVTKGRGKGIVYATGMKSELGKIADKLLETKGTGKTKLNKSLDRMALILLCVAIILIIVVFAVNKFKITPNALLYGVSLAIAVIPEGLIAVVTLAMAIGVRNMSKQQALVRKLNALEVLGSVTDICSDKTGTLTQSKMVLVRGWVPDEGIYKVSGLGFEPIGEVRNILDTHGEDEKPKRKSVLVTQVNMSDQFKLMATCSSLCNMAKISRSEENGEWVGVGDPTEIALQVFATKLGMGKEQLNSKGEGKYTELCEFAFDSGVKRMTVITQLNDGNKFAFMKGATEKVAEACTHIMRGNAIVPIESQELVQYVSPQIEAMASDGLRVISLAYRIVDDNETTKPNNEWARESFELNMVYLGLVGIYDPPRPESRISIQQCYSAGINVRMLTGDHPSTAAAIAKQVGIIPDDEVIQYFEKNNLPKIESLVMTATEFDALTPEQIDALPQLPNVIARCTPDTKVKLIEALHRRKAVVAMTGDGVNDSPSLKFADVGIAMGITGSDVAKQAADIILTDDNFATIVKAVAEGRRMFTNIRKFVTELIGSNISELVCLTVGMVFIDDSGSTVFPMSSVAILVNNILTGTPPAMSLGLEKAPKDNMKTPPRDMNDSLFTYEVICDILINGAVLGGLSITTFWLTLDVFGDGTLGVDCNLDYSESCSLVFRARGVTFAVLTMSILIFSYSCRDTRRQTLSIEKIRTLFENKALAFSFLFGAAITFIALYVPGVNKGVFKQSGITWEWGLVFACFALFLAFDAVYKWVKCKKFRPLHKVTPRHIELRNFAKAMGSNSSNK